MCCNYRDTEHLMGLRAASNARLAELAALQDARRWLEAQPPHRFSPAEREGELARLRRGIAELTVPRER